MLQKAFIEVLDRQAVIPAGKLPPIILVQFNPTEYTLNKGAQIAEIAIPGIDSPILQFIRGQNATLTMELLFDTTRPIPGLDRSDMGVAALDVRLLTEPIHQLVKIQSKTHAPPRVRFHWGLGVSFKAIVESVQQRFKLFSPLGVPLRATLSVTFREYKTLEEQLSELKLESSDHTKQHVVVDGDTLSSIAAREYGDPRLWRAIADHRDNRQVVRNPRRLTPGSVLVLPPLDGVTGAA